MFAGREYLAPLSRVSAVIWKPERKTILHFKLQRVVSKTQRAKQSADERQIYICCDVCGPLENDLLKGESFTNVWLLLIEGIS